MQGKWEHSFNKEKTKEQDFHISKDKTIKVPMMYQEEDFKYFDSTELNAQV